MMLVAPALLLSLAAQQFPEKASVIYTGVPRSSSPAAIKMVTHAATATLQKSDFTLTSLTFLKNTSPQPATVTVTLPVEGHNPDWNMTDHTTINVLVDDKPVQMVILLAVRESHSNGRHLQILSQLARKLMDEEFRARLLGFQDANAMVSHLSQELGVE